MVPRLRECCKSQAEVISKSSYKIHQTYARLLTDPCTLYLPSTSNGLDSVISVTLKFVSSLYYSLFCPPYINYVLCFAFHFQTTSLASHVLHGSNLLLIQSTYSATLVYTPGLPVAQRLDPNEVIPSWYIILLSQLTLCKLAAFSHDVRTYQN